MHFGWDLLLWAEAQISQELLEMNPLERFGEDIRQLVGGLDVLEADVVVFDQTSDLVIS